MAQSDILLTGKEIKGVREILRGNDNEAKCLAVSILLNSQPKILCGIFDKYIFSINNYRIPYSWNEYKFILCLDSLRKEEIMTVITRLYHLEEIDHYD